MKNFLIGMTLIVSSAYTQQLKQPGFRIEGHITGLSEKSSIVLVDANKPTDTLSHGSVRNGVFILNGHVHEPSLYELNFLTAKKKTAIFIGNDQMTIKGNIDNLSSIQVTGSPSQNDFISFQQTFTPSFTHLNQISQLANSPEGASKKDSIEMVYQTEVVSIQSKVDSFIQQRKSSFVSPFLLVVVNQLSDDVFLLERRYEMLAPDVKQSVFGQYLHDQIENGKIGAIGSDAMDFTQTDTSGVPVSLSSFKGKYVLVDFWASWCKPCRMENPNVVAAYDRFKNKNFTVLGVSLDRSRDAWVKAIQDDRLVWSQVSDLKFWNNAVAMQYRIQQIPQNILVDPNGKIVGKNLRGTELDSKLCALLGCN